MINECKICSRVLTIAVNAMPTVLALVRKPSAAQRYWKGH